MRDIGEGTIRRIDWQELIPVVLLLRIVNVSTGARVLLLSMLGVLLTLFCGGVMTLLTADKPVAPETRSASVRKEIAVETLPESSADIGPVPVSSLSMNFLAPLIDRHVKRTIPFRDDPDRSLVQHLDRSVLLPWNFFTKAGHRFFSMEPTSWRERGLALCWLTLVLFIWAFFGGLICRTVALRLTVDASSDVKELRRFMNERGLAFLSGTAILAVGILCCLIPVKLCGLLFAVPVLDYAVAILFPVALLFGFFAVVLLVGLWFGWPMLFAAVGVEGTDGFDAVSRMFSYVFQRPLHYLLYWAASGVLGFFGFVILSVFVYGVLFITIRVGGFPPETVVSTLDIIRQPSLAPESSIPTTLVSAWCGLVEMLLLAYPFAWFWTSAVTIYLLLRRSVDATPIVEVFRPGAGHVDPRGLPTIRSDGKGAPEIVTES